MTELENRLRRDAAKIHAEASPELRARVEAAVQAELAFHRPRPRERSRLSPTPRLLAGATLAAAVAVAGVLALRPEAPVPEPWPSTPVAESTRTPLIPAALRADFVLFEPDQLTTRPLEEEQERLEADLRRIEKELRRAF